MTRQYGFLLLIAFTLSILCREINGLSIKPPPIVACTSPIEVQRAIDLYIEPGDCVLELGAQLTDTSTALCKAVGEKGKAVLVDIKRSDAKSGRCETRDISLFLDSNQSQNLEAEENQVQFRELEQFDSWREIADEMTYQALVIDVGTMIGNDLHLTALSICNEFIAHQSQSKLKSSPPRVVIVKSKSLSNLARRIIHSQRLLDGSISIPEDSVRTAEPYIIPCVKVNEYRRTIPHVVSSGDDIIEVGCHFGRSTTLLDAAVNGAGGDKDGFCIGVDIGPKIIATARKEYEHIPFEVVDAWQTLQLLKIKIEHGRKNGGGDEDSQSSLGYDIVYADIGGLSGANGLLESLALLDSLAKALEPRCIVIKSLCTNRLASQLLAFSQVWNKIKKV